MAHPANKSNVQQNSRKATWLNRVLEDEWMNKVIEWTLRSLLLIILAMLSKSLQWIETYRIPWFKLTIVIFAAVWIVQEKDQIEQFWNQLSGQDLAYTTLFSSVQPVDHEATQSNDAAIFRAADMESKKNAQVELNPEASGETDGDAMVNFTGQAMQEYIQRFGAVARAEQIRFGIPASIKMAQAILESNAGQSGLALKNNNHFGIKCMSRSCKKGHCTNHADDHHKDFFVHYKSAWQSWRAHSELLMNHRYRPLFENDIRDYASWARGLQAAGYATDPAYALKIIDIIERHQLWFLDLPADEML